MKNLLVEYMIKLNLPMTVREYIVANYMGEYKTLQELRDAEMAEQVAEIESLVEEGVETKRSRNHSKRKSSQKKSA